MRHLATLGARIALAVTGWLVTDMCIAKHGTSSAFGVFVAGHDDSPLVLPIVDVGTGTTDAERAGAFVIRTWYADAGPLRKKVGKKLRAPRQTWPVDEVRRYAIRCVGPLADLTQSPRRRVLAHAVELNGV